MLFSIKKENFFLCIFALFIIFHLEPTSFLFSPLYGENIRELPKVTGPNQNQSDKLYHFLFRNSATPTAPKYPKSFSNTPNPPPNNVPPNTYIEEIKASSQRKREKEKSSSNKKTPLLQTKTHQNLAKAYLKNQKTKVKHKWSTTKISEPTEKPKKIKERKKKISSDLQNSKFAGRFRHPSPSFYRGIYVNNSTIRNPPKYTYLLSKAWNHGMNTLIIDVQPRMPKKDFLQYASQKGFYIVARIVVFQGGLKSYPPPQEHLKKIYRLVRNVASQGFMEIQLDYIRFTDTKKIKGLSLAKRYLCIKKILQEVRKQIRPYKIRLGADLFGRVAFNYDDLIGQNLELFASQVDLIYPMAYPSHFYGMPKHIRDPHKTVFESIRNSVRRVKGNARIVAYIQAFRMSIAKTGLSYQNYIYQQILAAEYAGGSGYIAWNAKNEYSHFFAAVEKYRKNQARKTNI